MSKLTELIEELCPDGVEYKPLGEVAGYVKDRRDSDSLEAVKFVGVDNLLPNFQGVDIPTYRPNTARVIAFQEGDILIGNIRPYLKKIWLADYDGGCSGDVLALRIAERFSSLLDAAYLYRVLASDSFFGFNMKYARGGKMPRGDKQMILRYEIPIPPLKVQQEIVRVLDAFTDLEQSLMAELDLRKKQLVNYRHACFASVLEGDGNIVSLSEAVEVRSGWGFPKSFQGASGGELPFYKVGDMNLSGNERFMTLANNYISETDAVDLKITPAPVGTVIFPKIGAAIATNKKRILTQDSAFDNNVMGLVPYDEVDSDYLFHWIQTVDLVRWGNSSGGVPSIRKTDVAKVPFFLPTRDLQKTVATMFNAFESLIQNIEQEIILRRKQYEFYRDELLTFTPKEA